jgi:hypothetical protein
MGACCTTKLCLATNSKPTMSTDLKRGRRAGGCLWEACKPTWVIAWLPLLRGAALAGRLSLRTIARVPG